MNWHRVVGIVGRLGVCLGMLGCAVLAAGQGGNGRDLPPRGELRRGESREWEVELLLRYRNRTRRPVAWSVHLPALRNVPPYQAVSGIKVVPVPEKEEVDSWGNRLLFFEFPGIPPGGVGQVRVTGRVRLTEAAYFPEGEEEIAALQPIVEAYDRTRGWVRADPQDAADPGSARCLEAAEQLRDASRRAGYEASLIGGVALRDPIRVIRELHAWVDLRLDPIGWLPIDPTLGRFDEEARIRAFLEFRPRYLILWRGVRSAVGGTVRSQNRLIDSPPALEVRYREVGPRNHSRPAILPPLSDIRELEKAEEEHPAREAARRRLTAGARFLAAGRGEEALREFAAARDLDPRFLQSHREWIRTAYLLGRGAAARAWYARAGGEFGMSVCLFHDGKYLAALRALDRLPPDERLDPVVLNHRGVLLTKWKAISAAVRHFREALVRDPGFDAPYRNLVKVYGFYERWEDVRTMARLAQQRFPDADEFDGEEGRALFFLGRHEEARRRFGEAIRKNRLLGWNHAMYGLACAALGRLEEARGALTRGLALGTGIADPAPFRERLARLRSRRGQ